MNESRYVNLVSSPRRVINPKNPPKLNLQAQKNRTLHLAVNHQILSSFMPTKTLK